MIVHVTDQSVKLGASICVRVILLCVSVRIPLTGTLDNFISCPFFVLFLF